MRPDFRIVLGESDLTDRFRERLLTVTVVDNSGEDGDTLEIALDDADNAIEAPTHGAVLGVSLGYSGADLAYLGRFTVDEVVPAGPPDTLTIRGKAADMREGLKAARSKAWRGTTIGGVVAVMAAAHGLEPAVSAELASRPITHRDQTNESDLHFLTRLGRDHGAVAAVKDGRLLFAAPASGQAASGQALEAVEIERGALIRWTGLAADRDSFGTVKARWRDRRAGRTRLVEVGDGQPVKTLRHVHASETEAKAAASAELERLKRGAAKLELTMEGRPEIMAQTPLRVVGLRPELAGDWITETVTHTQDYQTTGFETWLTAVRKPA